MFGWFKKKNEFQPLPKYRDLNATFGVAETGIKVTFNKNGTIDDFDTSGVKAPNRKPDLVQNMSIGFSKDGKCIMRREFFLKENICVLFNDEDAARYNNRNNDQIGVLGQCPLTKMLMVVWNNNNSWNILGKKVSDAYNNFLAESVLLENQEPIVIDCHDDEGW